jgi:hypothetical protein
MRNLKLKREMKALKMMKRSHLKKLFSPTRCLRKRFLSVSTAIKQRLKIRRKKRKEKN